MEDILRLLFVGIQLLPLNTVQHYTFRDQRFLFDLLYITFVIIVHSLQNVLKILDVWFANILCVSNEISYGYIICNY